MSTLVLFTKWLLAAEILAALTGFVTYQKWRPGYLKWFVVYLLIIVICETCNRLHIIQNNATAAYVFEYVVPFEILFINWFFYKSLMLNKSKIIIAGAALYVISWIIENTIFTKADYSFLSLSYTIGNLFILIYCILFFIELVNTDKILTFKTQMPFWIVCGLLVFYLGTFPFYGLYNELAKNLNIFIPVAWATTSLNYCMYLLFTIGFIWSKPH